MECGIKTRKKHQPHKQSTLREGSYFKLQYGVLIIDSWIFPEGWVLNFEGSYAGTAVSFSSGSTHFPCSLIKSISRSTASASGMLNLIAFFPT